MWSDSEDLSIISDLFQIKIKVITRNRRGNGDPTVNWINPDEEMKEYADLKHVDINEMVLIHDDDSHFNLIVAEDSELATKGSLSFRTNIGPLIEHDDAKDTETRDKQPNNEIEKLEMKNEIKSLKNQLKKSNDTIDFLKEDYIKCDFELRKKTEEVEKLKIELSSIKEFIGLQEKVEEMGKQCNKSNSENSTKSESKEHRAPEHVTENKIYSSECESKNSKSKAPTSKTDMEFCPETENKRYEQEDEFNCDECCFQGTSRSELRKHIRVKHMINCTDCNFYCNSKTDMETHKLLIHAKNSIMCRICGETFGDKSTMMSHRKTKHIKTVANCKYEVKGECRFSSQKCWWNHDFDLEIENKSENMFKCFTCNETFRSKGKMMLHKKQKHRHLVRTCIDNIDKKCTLNDESCWFKHEEASLKQTENVDDKKDEEEEKTQQKSVFRQVLENLEPPIEA